MIYSNDISVRNSPFIAWDNLIDTGTLAATSSAAGFPVAGLLNGYTTDPWRPNAMPARVRITLPSAAPVSCVAFAAHDMHTQGVTAEVQRLDGASWVSVRTVTPESDAPFIVSFPEVSSDEWRVIFTGSSTFRLAVLHVSRALVFPLSTRVIPPHVPLNRVSEVELIGGSQSGNGEFLQADTMRVGGTASLNFSVQSREFIHGADFEAFRQHYNRGKPFFFASMPRFDPSDMGYLWRQGNSITNPFRDAVFMALDMEAGVYVG